MKIQILSDLHLEFLKKAPEMPVLGDYLVLAGDIGYAGSPIWREWLRGCKQKYKQIYYIAGNHEFYNGTYSERLSLMRAEAGDNLTFLEKDVADIDGTSLRVLGTTLWTNVPAEETYGVSQMMADYKKIRHSGRNLKVDDTNYMHKEARKWLDVQTNKCAEDGKKAIVVTHHLPSFSMVADKYIGENNYGFASMCDDLIRSPVKLWVCGHSHTQMMREINGCPVVIGAIGYPSELRMLGPPSLALAEIGEDGEGVSVKWS
jgi:predicted phosphodiesterase